MSKFPPGRLLLSGGLGVQDGKWRRTLNQPAPSSSACIVQVSPNLKVSYDVLKRVAFGLEYYGAYGPWTHWDPLRGTQQLFVPAVDIDFGKRWEFNFGVGVGATQSTDHLLIKCILGYRFWGP